MVIFQFQFSQPVIGYIGEISKTAPISHLKYTGHYGKSPFLAGRHLNPLFKITYIHLSGY